VLIGLHYPGDVAAGALVGWGSAMAVHHLARRPLTSVVRAAGRATDPLLAPLWRLAERARARG
jgi:membrane-associated phospholipid phosphatase